MKHKKQKMLDDGDDNVCVWQYRTGKIDNTGQHGFEQCLEYSAIFLDDEMLLLLDRCGTSKEIINY